MWGAAGGGGQVPRLLRAERDVRLRPVADDPPRHGEGDHRRWWRGTGGAALRIKDRKHLACPSTMLRRSPSPKGGGSATSASHPKGSQQMPFFKKSRRRFRSEEHTSELQSLMRISYAAFCLNTKITHNTPY